MKIDMRRAGSLALAALMFTGVGAAVVGARPTPAKAARINATCTNSSGDAATIQSAINGSAVGDEIVIDGPCLINTTIRLIGFRSYRGDSASTTLTQASGANLAAILASDSWTDNSSYCGGPITLRDLTVNGNKSANPTGGDAVVIRSWDTTIENLRIEDSSDDGLRITDASQNGTTLLNTQVNGNIRDIFVSGSDGHGVFVQDSGNSVTDWNLTDSWIGYSGGDAIRLENSAGWVIERNHVWGVGGSGIDADRLFATSISDNYIEDFAVNGIGVALQGDTASTIHGNRVFQFNGSGTTFVIIHQVNYGTGYASVVGNAIRGGGSGTGLSYQRGSNNLTVTSTGNAVVGVTTQRSVGSGVTVNAGV